MSNIRRKLIMQQEENLLPPEYTAVNYIESFYGQYQYLDIDYIPDVANEKYEITAYAPYVYNYSGNEYFFGCGYLWKYVHIGMCTWSGTYVARIRKNSTQNEDVKIQSVSPNNNYNIYIHKISYDGYEIVDYLTKSLIANGSFGVEPYTEPYDLSIYVFGWNGGSAQDYTVMRLYNFQIKDKTTDSLTCNLVPCIRVSDNKPGVYDTVRNRFFVNMNNNGYDFSYN